MTSGLIVPVILCGGNGTRLWPMSQASRPKPFLPLVGERSLFEATLDRFSDAGLFAAPLIVAGQAHLDHVQAQAGRAGGWRVIAEPQGRNTAAAVALAAARLDPGDIMLVCPSDHHIGDPGAFLTAAGKAVDLAAQGWLVSLGVEAKTPDTGFGYLQRGEPIGEAGYRVSKFTEKPGLELATTYVADGGYSWNSGIFAFRVSDFLRELGLYRPDMLARVQDAVARGGEDGRQFHPDPEAFAAIKGESVDFAVMENTAFAAMVAVDMAWSDIGNWEALRAARLRDEAGNAVSGLAELVNCHNVFVQSDGPRVSVIGLEDLIIVVSGDEVLVTNAAGAQLVGKLSGASSQQDP